MVNPVLVAASRGDIEESLHRGAIAVCDVDGNLIKYSGDVARPVFPRSAVKPLQALSLVESGAADHFALSGRELALACASHCAEPCHLDLALAWLARLGLSVDTLECGGQPSAAHNNCSGKHCGMLTTALHLGLPTRGYIGPDHPVQQRIAAILCDMTGTSWPVPWGVDGCGIPTLAFPLAGLATAMARCAAPAALAEPRRDAARRLFAAMTAHPELVAGTGRFCTTVMQAVPGIAVKGGAEGVQSAMLPDLGLGIAIKIDDGAGRAADVALLAVLRQLGVLSADSQAALAAWMPAPIYNVAGRRVGEIQALFGEN